jgi:hypothetical protein
MMNMQQLFVGLLIVCALAFYFSLVENVQRGRWRPSLVMVLISSPGLLLALALTLERRIPDIFALPRALTLGDTFCLTGVAAIAALRCRRLAVRPGLLRKIVCLGIGFAGGYAFHRIDSQTYIDQGAGAMVDSPTMLAHDFVTIPVLFGAFCCFCWPILRRRSWHCWVILALLAVWAWLVFMDAQQGFDLWAIHIEWNTHTFSPAN